MANHETANIHPTAIIEAGAEIGANCEIGAYSTIGPNVKLGEGCIIKSHVAIDGHTSIGDGTQIFPFASIGHVPQDLKFDGEKTYLEIGSHNRIREHVTMNPGTKGGGSLTKIGNNGLFMVGVHIGHDCIIGDGAIFANNATLGGHVVVGDHVVIGGLAAIHQFVRIGTGAVIGGMSPVAADVIPFGAVSGERATLEGLNLVGLKRKNTDRELINGLRAAYKALFSSDTTLHEAASELQQKYQENPLVTEMTGFILSETSRHLCTPKKN